MKALVNKKKGFTLIELMVAITILAIIYPAITSAFLTAQRSMEDENSMLETAAQAQYLLQSLQVQGREGVEIVYDKYRISGAQKAAFYLYYEDNAEITDTVEKLADSGEAEEDISLAVRTSTDSPDSSLAKTAMDSSGIDRLYAAHVLIVLDLPPESEGTVDYFNVYKVVIDTWKFKGSHYVGSHRVAYIGE